MRKSALAALLLLAPVVAALSQSMAFRSYAEDAGLYFGSPASAGTAWNGYLNPALLGTLDAPELLLIFSTAPGRWATPAESGLFGAFPGLGLGALSFTDASGQPQMNVRVSLGFGDRSFALGLANESAVRIATGESLLFHAITVGALVRPWPFVSLGISGTTTYTGDAMEATADLGIRPFGTPLVTLFGDSTLGKVGTSVPFSWGAGAVIEPLPGIRLGGRLASDFTFTLGAQVSFGAADLGTQLRFETNATPESAV